MGQEVENEKSKISIPHASFMDPKGKESTYAMSLKWNHAGQSGEGAGYQGRHMAVTT